LPICGGARPGERVVERAARGHAQADGGVRQRPLLDAAAAAGALRLALEHLGAVAGAQALHVERARVAAGAQQVLALPHHQELVQPAAVGAQRVLARGHARQAPQREVRLHQLPQRLLVALVRGAHGVALERLLGEALQAGDALQARGARQLEGGHGAGVAHDPSVRGGGEARSEAHCIIKCSEGVEDADRIRPAPTRATHYYVSVPTVFLLMGFVAGALVTILATWAVARNVMRREEAIVRLLSSPQAGFTEAAASGVWPLTLEPLPPSEAGSGETGVWDLLGSDPVPVTRTPGADLDLHQRLLQAALDVDRDLVIRRVRTAAGRRLNGLAVLVRQQGELAIVNTFCRERPFSERELNWA